MPEEQDQPYSVSDFIQLINHRLGELKVEIIGEVCEIKVAASGHAYFTLKDKDTGDILLCVMWRGRYSVCGVDLEVGMEVQIKGQPEFYGKFGKLSFIATTIELVGEGALKKAYEKMRKKLTAEGLFETSRKRALPAFPRTIGVITSVRGAVIHDFSNNLRKSGFKVKILDSRVEGPESGSQLALSVRALRKEKMDVLVLIRGGGSIQSLAGFDNEALVREIARFPVPVITGIGHHQDITLAALASDAAESTPSLVAALLGQSWNEAERSLERSETHILTAYSSALRDARDILTATFDKAKESLDTILQKYEDAKSAVKNGFGKIEAIIADMDRDLSEDGRRVLRSFQSATRTIKSEYFSRIPQQIRSKYVTALRNTSVKIQTLARLIDTNSPERQLRLGYSIAFNSGRIVRSVKEAKVGEQLEVRVADGEILSEVKSIK